MTYKLPDGRTQGAPGTIKLEGQTVVERKLLLGSESSGKFRYDEGVKQGTFLVRFRNSNGKLLAKFSTDFSLLSNTKELVSPDGNFKVTLTKQPQKTFFVLMQTFGLPDDPPDEVKSGPYGLFTLGATQLAGSVNLGNYQVFRWTGSEWTNEVGGDAFNAGIFIGTSK